MAQSLPPARPALPDVRGAVGNRPPVVEAKGRPADLLEAGLEALADRRWEEARTAFEEALREEEAPEALEGLSWAAWWLDDAETVFQARERAYRLYRQRADAASAARMGIWLAADHLDFKGAFSVATGWLRRAARLLEPLEPGPEQGWLAFQEGYLAHLAGDSTTARALARRAAEAGRRFGVADLEMLGLALEGGALVASAEVTEGMRCLDEASVAALEDGATVAISGAWAICFLVTACLDVRDYRRAFEWCDRIAEFGERHQSRYMMGFCRSHYGAVHLTRGRWTDAESELLAAAEDYARSRPALVGDALVWLAELRRRQGRADAALDLLDQVGERADAQVCRARLALDRGDALRAIELAERCLRQIAEDRRLERAPAVELLVRATIVRGDLSRAASALAELRTLDELVGTLPLRASARFAEGALAAARGDHEDARRCLEDATDAYERSGAVFDALTARVELARSLVSLGRLEVAEQEGRAAVEGLTRLGAELEAARARRVLAACTGAGSSSAMPAVTPRERDVLRLLAEGLTNRQIAERLAVSEHTVHRHVTNILRKLDLPSRAAAAAHAVRAGLLAEAET
jgi:LuxR family transcriptional regulator, maltose regulon positive regulatory protein